MKKTRKNSIVIALIVLLLALAVGYAAFSSELTIEGTANALGTWDVKFKSVALKDSEGQTANESYGSATITSTEGTKQDKITATINLAYPGDAVMLEATVTNAGNTPAKLTKPVIDGLTSSEITITPATVTNEERLEPGEECTIQYAIQWKPDSTVTSIDEQTFTITYEYNQDTTTVDLTPTHTHN